MKQYVIDQLRPEDFTRVEAYMEKHLSTTSGIGGIYWLMLDDMLLTEEQMRHEACKPFYFAIELVAPDRLSCELLVRTKSKVRCACICYANENQRNWVVDQVDQILENLNISI